MTVEVKQRLVAGVVGTVAGPVVVTPLAFLGLPFWGCMAVAFVVGLVLGHLVVRWWPR